MRTILPLQAVFKGLQLTGLHAENLTCWKQDRVLFAGLNFSLPPGELVYLRGPNGVGKTSLLRILAGLSQPQEGQVLFNELPLSNTDSTWAKNLTYVGHKSGLNLTLDAIDNLRFWSAQHGIEFNQTQCLDVLENLNLMGVERVPIKHLSAGQQRRVALSRLWLKRSPYWLLDEPFTALDADGIKLLELEFKQHVARGGSILTTSHQPLSNAAGEYRELTLEYPC